jgi:hypothetical protein
MQLARILFSVGLLAGAASSVAADPYTWEFGLRVELDNPPLVIKLPRGFEQSETTRRSADAGVIATYILDGGQQHAIRFRVQRLKRELCQGGEEELVRETTGRLRQKTTMSWQGHQILVTWKHVELNRHRSRRTELAALIPSAPWPVLLRVTTTRQVGDALALVEGVLLRMEGKASYAKPKQPYADLSISPGFADRAGTVLGTIVGVPLGLFIAFWIIKKLNELPDRSEREAALHVEPAQPPATEHICRRCGHPSRVHARYLGRELRCPQCGQEFTVEAVPAGGAQPGVDSPPAAPD